MKIDSYSLFCAKLLLFVCGAKSALYRFEVRRRLSLESLDRANFSEKNVSNVFREALVLIYPPLEQKSKSNTKGENTAEAQVSDNFENLNIANHISENHNPEDFFEIKNNCDYGNNNKSNNNKSDSTKSTNESISFEFEYATSEMMELLGLKGEGLPTELKKKIKQRKLDRKILAIIRFHCALDLERLLKKKVFNKNVFKGENSNTDTNTPEILAVLAASVLEKLALGSGIDLSGEVLEKKGGQVALNEEELQKSEQELLKIVGRTAEFLGVQLEALITDGDIGNLVKFSPISSKATSNEALGHEATRYAENVEADFSNSRGNNGGNNSGIKDSKDTYSHGSNNSRNKLQAQESIDADEDDKASVEVAANIENAANTENVESERILFTPGYWVNWCQYLKKHCVQQSVLIALGANREANYYASSNVDADVDTDISVNSSSMVGSIDDSSSGFDADLEAENQIDSTRGEGLSFAFEHVAGLVPILEGFAGKHGLRASMLKNKLRKLLICFKDKLVLIFGGVCLLSILVNFIIYGVFCIKLSSFLRNVQDTASGLELYLVEQREIQEICFVGWSVSAFLVAVFIMLMLYKLIFIDKRHRNKVHQFIERHDTRG